MGGRALHRTQTPAGGLLRGRQIAAATLGNALEFYDFLIFAFFAIQIGRAFFPVQSAYGSLMLSLGTFGAGFVTRPLGAIVIGGYADRVGRRPAMILSFALMGASIIFMALIPPYGTIGIAAPILAVLARMVQGFSLGGEIGSNTAFLVEASSPERRGLTVCWQIGSQNLASVVGGLVGLGLTSVLPGRALDAYGWRLAFLIGAATLPVGLWLRRHLPETLYINDVKDPRPRLQQARGAWRIILLGFVVLACATIGSYISTYTVTFAQQSLHLSASIGFLAVSLANISGIFAVFLGGWLSDRIGRWPINVWGNLAFLILIYPVFAWVAATRSPVTLVVGMVALGTASAFSQGSLYASLAESLPKTIRGSGFGIVYSLAIAAFGGTTQLVVTWLIHVTGRIMVPAWYLLAATCLGQVAIMLILESAPTSLARRQALKATPFSL